MFVVHKRKTIDSCESLFEIPVSEAVVSGDGEELEDHKFTKREETMNIQPRYVEDFFSFHSFFLQMPDCSGLIVMAPPPAPLPPLLARREESVAVGLDAEHDELLTAGHLLLLQEHSLPEVGGHTDGAHVVRAPAAAALRAPRRLSPRGDAVPQQFARPKTQKERK